MIVLVLVILYCVLGEREGGKSSKERFFFKCMFEIIEHVSSLISHLYICFFLSIMYRYGE